jgi:RNA polymerase sigma factor (sigma-70 family)
MGRLMRVLGMDSHAATRPPARVSDPLVDSFELFYTGTVDRVYRALAVALADVHLAREATDEAMARAYVHWRRVATHDSPGGWAFRVGLNWATSWRRKVRRERPLPDAEPLSQAALPDEGGLVAMEALTGLPVAQRAVVVCRVLFDLSTAETAAVLRLPEGTVRSRLCRAIAVLRSEFVEPDPREEER